MDVLAHLGVILRPVFDRFADEHRRARYRRKDRIGQCRRLPGRALIRHELGVAAIPDFDHALAAFDGEPDRHLLDRHHFADELDEIADRAAELAGVDGQDGVLLRRRDAIVEINRRPPVALKDVAGHVGDHRDRAIGHIDAVDRSLVEMPRDDRVAGLEIGILADPARTQYPTVANFEQTAFELITHGRFPSRQLRMRQAA